MDQFAGIIALVAPIFVVAIALEFIVDRVRGTGFYRLSDAINSLSLGILSTYVQVGLRALTLVPYALVAEHLAPWTLPADHWAVWLLAFVFYDFMYYWLHRKGHEWNILWSLHVVHHQSEEFNLTTALRQPALGPLFAWPFFIPLALVGIPWEVAGVVSVLQLLYQFWPHTRHVGRMGVLDRWIQTPSNHRVHHAQNDIYLDRNYGGILMVWDRMFGTFQDELDSEPCIYGIRGQLRSWNPLWANWHVWQDVGLTAWRAQRWWDKLKVWFAPPGWRPADVAAAWPKPPYRLEQFRRFDPAAGRAVRAYALAQFAGAYLLAAHFLKVIRDLPLAESVAYAGVITLLLVSLGGLLEGRRRFLAVEALRVAGTGAGAALAGGWFGGIAGAWVVWVALGWAGLSLLGLTLAVLERPEPLPAERPSVAAE